MAETKYKYDVFLSYSRSDAKSVEKVARYLSDVGLNIWFDEWSLVPGQPWEMALKDAFESSFAIAVFISSSPFSNFQQLELETFLNKQRGEVARRVIPVLLPGYSWNIAPSSLRDLAAIDLSNIDFSKDIELSNELKRLVSMIIYNVLSQDMQIGDNLWKSGDLNGALKHCEKALRIAEKIKYVPGKAILFNNLGVIYQYQGNYKKAVKLFRQSLELEEEAGDKIGVARTLHNLGVMHQDQGNYDEAIKLFKQSLKIREDLGDKQGIAYTLHQLGMIHQDQGNYEEAVNYYQKSLKIVEELGDKSGIARSLHNLGAIHQDQGNYEEAVNYYQKSLKLKEELGDKSGIARSLHQLGNIHYQQGNYDEAIKLYQQSLMISEQLGDKSGIASTLHQLGNIHYQQGNYDEAIKLYPYITSRATMMKPLNYTSKA
jgi:tetratricopeptide (TPR) repeat protein